ncbi:hypothetical protein BDV93DRAFT_506399 [Ceratobasidium sp. AG-I]|nr:hypothetical protein BDV93DRAFT_506399 [Ceratobasidium sp. AG-I]
MYKLLYYSKPKGPKLVGGEGKYKRGETIGIPPVTEFAYLTVDGSQSYWRYKVNKHAALHFNPHLLASPAPAPAPARQNAGFWRTSRTSGIKVTTSACIIYHDTQTIEIHFSKYSKTIALPLRLAGIGYLLAFRGFQSWDHSEYKQLLLGLSTDSEYELHKLSESISTRPESLDLAYWNPGASIAHEGATL